MPMIWLIKFIVACAVSALWIPLGFFFWVPVLFRVTASFTFALVHATLAARNAKISSVPLDHAVGLWINGFGTIWSSVFPAADTEADQIPFNVSRMLLETAWALLFWYVSILLLSHLLPGMTGVRSWLLTPVYSVVDVVEGTKP